MCTRGSTRFRPVFAVFHCVFFFVVVVCRRFFLCGGKFFFFIAAVTDLHSVVATVFTLDPVWCLTVDSVETLHLGKYTVTT